MPVQAQAPAQVQVAAPTSLLASNRSDTPSTLRPGVDASTMLASVRHIQQAWRDCRHRLRILYARNQLEGRAIECGSGATLRDLDALPDDVRAKFHATSKSIPATKTVAAAPCCAETSGGFRAPGDPEAAWDEALTFRQTSAEQAIRAQNRWLREYSVESQQVQLDWIQGDAVTRTVQDVTCLETRLQLRRRESQAASGGVAAAWRPPSAVGATACQEIEKEIGAWRAQLRGGSLSAPEPNLAPGNDAGRDACFPVAAWPEVLVLPCLCLLLLTVACSRVYRGEVVGAQQALAAIDAALAGAPTTSFLFAVGTQLRARALLQIARCALLTPDFLGACAATERALAFLEDRRGPRDFWPPHCWEHAACYRTKVLALAGLQCYKEAIAALDKLEPLVAPASMRQAAPRVAEALIEDVRVLRLECEAARDTECGLSAGVVPAAALQVLADSAERLQCQLKGLYTTGRCQAIMAKLTLLQELPWYGSGCARTEALEMAATHLASSRRCLGEAAYAQKLAGAEAVCAAMRGQGDGAMEAAEAWAQECQVVFKREDERNTRASRLIRELVKTQESLSQAGAARSATKHAATPSGSCGAIPPAALQGVVCDSIAIVGPGLRASALK